VERPDDGEIRQKLGEAYLKAGRVDEAIETLAGSLELLGKKEDRKLMARSKSSLGRARFTLGEMEGDESAKNRAVDELKEAVGLDPELLSASYNLMVAYRKTGKVEEARRVFESIKSMEPDDAEGWISIGKAFLDKGERSKALFAFKKAAELGGGRFAVYEEISTALYHHKAYKEALDYLEKAKASDPSNVFSYNLAGIIHRVTGEYAAAVEEYKKAAKIDPDDAAVHFNLGVAYYKINEEKKCAESFKKAKSLNPDMPELDSYIERLGIAI